MIETEEGWVCNTHDPGSEEWQVLMSLGAKMPCRVPGGVKKRMQTALDKRSKPLTLQLLARDEDVGVRGGVAMNRNTPASALTRLSEDSSHPVARMAAQNPNLPVESIQRLARSQRNELCDGAAANPSAPPDLLEELAGHVRWRVREAAAKNLNTAQHVYLRLLEDDHLEVSLSLGTLTTRKLPRFLSWHPAFKKALERAVNDATPKGRMALLYCPNLPRTILKQLSKDDNTAVRAVAQDKLRWNYYFHKIPYRRQQQRSDKWLQV